MKLVTTLLVGLTAGLPFQFAVSAKAAPPFCNSIEAEGKSLALEPNRFATLRPVDGAFSANTATHSNGMARWEWTYRACGAPSMGLFIRDLYLPAGWQLTATNQDGEAQTLKANAMGGVQSWPMSGEALTLTSTGPSESAEQVQIDRFELSIGIPGRADRGPPMGSSRAAERQAAFDPEAYVNASCFTDSNPLAREVSQATATLLVGGNFCTGTLVNHANAAQRPLIITAAHCVDPLTLDAQSFAAQGRVLARFEATEACGSSGASAFDIGGEPITSVGTAYIEYNALGTPGRQNDYWVIEMDDYPRRAGPIRMLGYDLARASIGSNALIIHHGRVRAQQLAEGFVAGYQESFGSPDTPDSDLWRASAQYRVRSTTGCTRGGASGSAMVDEEGRVRGTLYGGSVGESSCSSGVSSLDDAAGSPALRAIFVSQRMNGAPAPMPRATATPTPQPTPTPTATPTPAPSVTATPPPQSSSSGGGSSGLGFVLMLAGAAIARSRARRNS